MRICLRNKDFNDFWRIGSFWVKAMKNPKFFEKNVNKLVYMHVAVCLLL